MSYGSGERGGGDNLKKIGCLCKEVRNVLGNALGVMANPLMICANDLAIASEIYFGGIWISSLNYEQKTRSLKQF